MIGLTLILGWRQFDFWFITLVCIRLWSCMLVKFFEFFVFRGFREVIQYFLQVGCPYLYLSHHQRSCLFIIVCSMKFFESTVFYSTVLWRCWLGGRKGILPVKKLRGGMLVWLSVCSEVQTCTRSSWCHCHSLSLASVKSRLVLPFWYQLTWVVPDKGTLNVCVCTVFCSTAVRWLTK